MMVTEWFETEKERQEFIELIQVRRPNKAFINVEHDGKFYTSFELSGEPFAGLDELIDDQGGEEE